MPNMTPEQARRLLDTDSRSTHGPGTNCRTCEFMKLHTREMMHQIAGMTYEYAVQYLTPDGWAYSRESWDCRWQDNEAVQEVRALRDHPGEETRIVRRLVSQPEEAPSE